MEGIMIKARCFRCGSAITLTEQHIANALAAEGVAEKPSHYMAECPNCRRMNKVSLKGVRLPPPEGPAPEQSEGTEDKAEEADSSGQ
jgi:hypothetical protein